MSRGAIVLCRVGWEVHSLQVAWIDGDGKLLVLFVARRTIAPFCDATGGWLPLLCTQNCTTVPQEMCSSSGLVSESNELADGSCNVACEG